MAMIRHPASMPRSVTIQSGSPADDVDDQGLKRAVGVRLRDAGGVVAHRQHPGACDVVEGRGGGHR